MERSFHSPLGTKSPFSPRSRQSLSSQRQIGPPTFRKLSYDYPFLNVYFLNLIDLFVSSRLSGSVKSAQGVQIILKSNQNYVERFGQPLPVLVTEALTFAESKLWNYFYKNLTVIVFFKEILLYRLAYRIVGMLGLCAVEGFWFGNINKMCNLGHHYGSKIRALSVTNYNYHRVI